MIQYGKWFLRLAEFNDLRAKKQEWKQTTAPTPPTTKQKTTTPE